jgi:imidazoleglycerol-phosphate dehydratase/histidinol-phosphatase
MKKKAIFIDRDGTIIEEPQDTKQVDTLEQLVLMPKVLRNLFNIVKNLDFELVMVSNQDGMGTPEYPEKNFLKVQGKLIEILRNEDIIFNNILIDRSKPEENKPSRKPGTEMLGKYLTGNYDLDNSFVIGDRISDIVLAKNMGCKGIMYGNESNWDEVKENSLEKYCELITDDWDEIYSFISLPQRSFRLRRVTNETAIDILINLDGHGNCDISTGLKFLDHMLSQIGRHAGFDLAIEVNGDLDVDEHHTIEDTAIALGEAINNAIGKKAGMQRYGFCLPMDDCLAQVALDFGGRGWLVWDVEFKREKIGDVPTEMFFHFFKSFSDAARCNLNIKAEGDNEHHKIESIFKALARSIRMAIHRDTFNMEIPSTKGII